MTRPKVPDDKRQRTAQACDSCKRRKQKCNGLKPCQTCVRRQLTCSYTTNGSASDYGPGESAGSPTKKRHIETSPPTIEATLEAAEASPPQADGEQMQQSPAWEDPRSQPQTGVSSAITSPTAPLPPPLAGRGQVRKVSINRLKKLPTRPPVNGQSEETTIYTETRMLQDQTGRLLYLGDASTLSILQLIRIIVENTAGTAMGHPFIDDPKRHRIMENIIEFPEGVRIPSLLPDKPTADYLIKSYFTNTCGMIEVFDKPTFLRQVELCYADPLTPSNYFLCHLFLVLALGLLLAAPEPGSPEDMLVQKQLSAKPDRAELFFRSAKSMCDPGAGFEDADFWSVQALSLMTLYMLVVSKRNTAYAYLGMAVRSAYALGLHREETMNEFIFTHAEMRIRRNMWKTLFILDRFLAATLGRPTAISEDDCSCKIMADSDSGEVMSPGAPPPDSIHAMTLDACVRSCHIIGNTLKVFSARKISTAVVQEIVDESRDWDLNSHVDLERRSFHGPRTNPADVIAHLHLKLLSLHSLILLTRQLFVMHNWKLVEMRSGIKKQVPIHKSPMARFSEACVVASYQTVNLVRRVYEEGYLPQRNPFIIYFVFAASLVIFMNQFSSLYYTDEYGRTVTSAITMMEYCARIDPQAERVLDIMKKFRVVVENWTHEHTYNAPPLSRDLSCLYSHPPSPRLPPLHTATGAGIPGFHDQASARPVNVSDPGLLTPPTLPKLPLSGILDPQQPGGILDTRMNGMSPSQTAGPSLPPIMESRPSLSAQSAVDSSDSMSGDIEFDFDRLWNNWINHVAPAAAHSGMANIAPPAETFGAYTMPPGTRIPPLVGINGNLPLFHSANFG